MTGQFIEQQLFVNDFERHEREAQNRIKQALLEPSASSAAETKSPRSHVDLIANYVKSHRSTGQSGRVPARS